LLSEKLVLGNKRCARTEPPHHQPHESAEHRGRVSRRGNPSSRIGAVPESSQDGCMEERYTTEGAEPAGRAAFQRRGAGRGRRAVARAGPSGQRLLEDALSSSDAGK
jgi:hypothetical protein